MGYLTGVGIFVIAVPAVILLSTQSISWEIFSNPEIKNDLLIVFASLVFFWGLIFVIWSNISLLVKGKGGPTEGLGISVSPKTKNLVIKGPYRYTRNPMVFGMLSIYYSIVLFLNSLIGLVIVIVITIVAIIYLKTSEEKRLLKDFDDAYVQYKQKVSMIIPIPNKLYSKN